MSGPAGGITSPTSSRSGPWTFIPWHSRRGRSRRPCWRSSDRPSGILPACLSLRVEDRDGPTRQSDVDGLRGEVVDLGVATFDDPGPVDTALDVIRPDDIEVDYVPRPSERLFDVAVGTELVVVDGLTWQAHILNPTAALVWRCLDGETSLEELVADFSDAMQTDPDVVRTDLLDMTRGLGRAGLLDGVAEPVETEEMAVDWTPPEPVEVGARL